MGLLSSEISTKKMVPLCRKMAMSYESGISMLESLELRAQEGTDARLKKVLRQIHDDIRAGASLEDAVRAQSKYLSPFFVEMMATGEMGGKLSVMLRDLADYFEDRLKMQRQVIRSTVGPGLRLVASWFLGSFALRLVPQLSVLALDVGSEKFDVMSYLGEYGMFQLKVFGACAPLLVLVVILIRLGLFGWVSGVVTAHIWPLAPLTRKFALARFFRTMSLLVDSGMAIDKCILNSSAVTMNPYISKDLLKALPKVKEGATLDDAFKDSRHMTPTMREMLRVGEKTGKLGEALHKASDYSLEEATHAVSVATNVIDSVIVLAVSLLIGYIVYTFFSIYSGFLEGIMDDLKL